MKPIASTGPDNADVMIVGERPGLQEMKAGVCFCGPSGQELDRYLLINSGISRDDVRCTNLVRDYRDGDNPTPEEVQRDWPLLMAEIETVKPRFIGAVGLWSARALLGSDIDMDWAHGLEFEGVMPLFHPAGGLHQPATAVKIAWDFEQFGRMIRGESVMRAVADAVTTNYKESPLSPSRVRSQCGVDTEGSADAPWGLSYSCDTGYGRVSRDGNGYVFDDAILHNAIHDLPVLQAMGVQLGEWTDTMAMAALLGTEPLGLKALARRYAGMIMSDYAEVVGAAQQEMALEYLTKVLEFAIASTDPTTAG